MEDRITHKSKQNRRTELTTHPGIALAPANRSLAALYCGLRKTESMAIESMAIKIRSIRSGVVDEMEFTMQKTWILEMHHPDDGDDSLISRDSFDDFAEVELKIKQNREMVFAIRAPKIPRARDLLALDELEKSGLKIRHL